MKIASATTHAGGENWRLREDAAANAALIVRAVNNHDALVAAIDDLLARGDDGDVRDRAFKLLASLE